SQLLTALGWEALVLIERVIASFLPPGTITALTYGLKIMSTIGELITGSVGTSALPSLARAAQTGRSAGIGIFRDALEISMVLVTPVMACCLLFARPIMKLLFQHGRFSPQATGMMALIFFCYSLSLLPWSGVRLLAYYLFARHEMRSFLRICGLYYGLTAALDLFYVFALHFGPKGIPLALLTSLIVTCVVAYAQNLADIREVCDHALGILAGKDLAAGVLAAIVMWRFGLWLGPVHGDTHLTIFLCETCGAGFIVFFATMAAWRVIPFSRLKEVWSNQ
ncbi:MAG: lipid II flippase MurJ, partial [Candidatus Acidiferrales bacterium]